MRNQGNPRLQLVVIAAALFIFVVAQVAIAGGPGATESASVKSLKKKVARLSKAVATLNTEMATLRAEQGAPRPPSGAAGGDLTGSYPSPSLKGAPAAQSAGLATGSPVGSCNGVTNAWANDDTVPVSYYRDLQGTVFLQGAALRCGSPSGNLFTLPAGFRPADHVIAPVFVFSASTGVFINGSSGLVSIQGTAPAPGASMGLNGVSFRCGPSGQNGCP